LEELEGAVPPALFFSDNVEVVPPQEFQTLEHPAWRGANFSNDWKILSSPWNYMGSRGLDNGLRWGVFWVDCETGKQW